MEGCQAHSVVEIPNPAPRVAAGSWASALEGHPRLLGPDGWIRKLVKAKQELYEQVKSSADSLLLAAGIVHAVEGLPPRDAESWTAKGMKVLEHGVTNIHQDTWIWLTNAALTYDFFFDAIPPSDRQRLIDWINPHFAVYTDDENAFHNSTASKMLCYLRIAYATWGENAMAKSFRDHALLHLYEGRLLPVLRELGDGGGWTECGWYQRHSLWHLAEALELSRRIEGYDGFRKALRFFYQRMAYEMLHPYPKARPDGTERFALEGDGSDRYWTGDESPRHLRNFLSTYFRGSELSRYVANMRRPGLHPMSRISDFLYEEESDEPLPIEEFPLAHIAARVGKVHARSDWSEDATWFRFECSDFWNHHQHFEVGNFEIFRRETLATESGEYHDYLSNHAVNWLTRTIAHNCILVYRPDEQWVRMRDGGRHEYFNDGGQAKKWQWVVSTLEEWQRKREQFETGRIIAYENQPQYLFLAGDCTKAYSPSKLALWIRQIVFVRPETFVVFDRVVSTRPEYPKTWLLHCRREPEIKGREYLIANGDGRLAVYCLLPDRPIVRTVEGYTYGGQTFPPDSDRLSATANRWRIEESPPEARTEDFFLHIMTTGEPRLPELIGQEGRVGARMANIEVVFAGDVGGTLTISGRPFSLTAGIKRGRYE